MAKDQLTTGRSGVGVGVGTQLRSRASTFSTLCGPSATNVKRRRTLLAGATSSGAHSFCGDLAAARFASGSKGQHEKMQEGGLPGQASATLPVVCSINASRQSAVSEGFSGSFRTPRSCLLHHSGCYVVTGLSEHRSFLLKFYKRAVEVAHLTLPSHPSVKPEHASCLGRHFLMTKVGGNGRRRCQ